MINRKQRWWVLLGTLVLTLLAVQWVDSGEAPPALPAGESSPAQAPATGTAKAEIAAVPEVRLERLRREPYPALKTDLFRSELPLSETDSEGVPIGEGGRLQRPAGPPPLPPLPFAYMGKMLEDGETVVFLTRGDRNYVVRKGATLDGRYRVDEIGPRTMVLTYLPGRVKQSLAIGSAP